MIAIMRGLYVLSIVAALTTVSCSSRSDQEQRGPGRLIARHQLKVEVSDEERGKVFQALTAKLDSDKLVGKRVEEVPEIDYATEIAIGTRLIEYVIPSKNEVEEGTVGISILVDARTGIITRFMGLPGFSEPRHKSCAKLD